MANEKYLNFPIGLLKDAFDDIKGTMDNIMKYAGYVHAEKLEFGDETERMKASGHFFGITYGNPKRCHKDGECLFNSLLPNLPMTGIEKDVSFKYYKHYKTPDQIAVLLAFLAIKSIVGSKPYYKTNREQIIVRMAGFASIKNINEVPEKVKQFNTRRKFDKIKFELQTKWNVNFYSYYTRGFYVSIDKKFSLDQLVFEAEKNRKINKEKELKIKQKEAREKALNELKNKNNSEN
jgi:hypothetical protein